MTAPATMKQQAIKQEKMEDYTNYFDTISGPRCSPELWARDLDLPLLGTEFAGFDTPPTAAFDSNSNNNNKFEVVETTPLFSPAPTPSSEYSDASAFASPAFGISPAWIDLGPGPSPAFAPLDFDPMPVPSSPPRSLIEPAAMFDAHQSFGAIVVPVSPVDIDPVAVSRPIVGLSNAAAKAESKKRLTGTRRAADCLIDLDAPTVERTYATPSTTSKKRLPPSITAKVLPAVKKARGVDLDGLDPEHVPDEVLSAIELKRRQNTIAARKSRMRKAGHLAELEQQVADLKEEVELWKSRYLKSVGADA